MVGAFSTVGAGSATVNSTALLYDASAYDVVVDSSADASMGTYNTSAPIVFASARASILYGAVHGSVMYYRFRFRDNLGATLRTSPVRAVVVP
jgi:hypothetical protein